VSMNLPPEGRRETPIPADVVPGPATAVPRRGRRAGQWVLLILVLGLAGSMLLNLVLLMVAGLGAIDTDSKVREKYHSRERYAGDKVAIITVEGLITDGEGFVKQQIKRVKDDKSVKAVVLRVNSPGGTVSGSDYIYHHLRKLTEEREIPLVVSMGGVAASGGYYVSMAVGQTPETIFAEPTTWTGSIGVIIPHYSFADLMERWGIEDNSIASHPLKDMLSPTKPMTKEEQQILQTLVDDTFTRFKTIVKNGRPRFQKSPEALDKIATGQVFTAQQALDAGLVDRLGFVDEAIDRAIALAGLEADKVKVVEYKPEPRLANLLLGAEQRGAVPDLKSLLELTVPRAYYLCTWLPSMAAKPQPG